MTPFPNRDPDKHIFQIPRRRESVSHAFARRAPYSATRLRSGLSRAPARVATAEMPPAMRSHSAVLWQAMSALLQTPMESGVSKVSSTMASDSSAKRHGHGPLRHEGRHRHGGQDKGKQQLDLRRIGAAHGHHVAVRQLKRARAHRRPQKHGSAHHGGADERRDRRQQLTGSS